ncbi:MAG TPA: single-stranded DNA-binding protein [Gammaproteobacteria bacterium]|nr:single-stranded DNA-binding protein [Gammaproteobacteria bacterium]
MNIFTFTGRLGKDADIRYTASGIPVACFTAANDIGFGDKKRTQWVKCTIWGKLAESGVIPYLTKGREVAISGEVTLDEYTARDGTNKASLSVRVVDLTLIGAKGANSTPKEEAFENTKDLWETPAAAAKPSTVSNGFDDELPF